MISCYEQLVAHKSDHLNETDQILERYKLPKLTQRESDQPNRSASIK